MLRHPFRNCRKPDFAGSDPKAIHWSRGTLLNMELHDRGNIWKALLGAAILIFFLCIGVPHVIHPARFIKTWASYGSGSNSSLLSIQEYVNTARPELAHWDAALHNCQNQVTRVFVTGTSLGVVDVTYGGGLTGTISATFGNRWVDRLRTTLQGICGSHGTGFVPFIDGVGFGVAFNRDFYPGVTGSATLDTAIGPYVASYGTTIKTASAMTIPFVANVAYDHLNVYCASGPGLHRWTMIVDGATVGSCGGSADSLAATLGTSSGFTLGAHTTTIACITAPCEGSGAEGIAGTTGVSVDNMSYSSCPIECFFGLASSQTAFRDIIPDGPALDIIWQINNEPGSRYTPSQFSLTWRALIAHDRAYTYPPSILQVVSLANAQDATGSAPASYAGNDLEAYVPVVLASAQSLGTAYVNLRDRWGSNPVPFLLGPDGVHMSDAGNGEAYTAITQMLIDFPVSSSIVPRTTCAKGHSLSVFGPERWYMLSECGVD